MANSGTVYYCCVDTKTNEWRWNCVQAIASSAQLRFPVVVDSYPEWEEAPTHFDLVCFRD